jgi:RHS repeat-associated protein
VKTRMPHLREPLAVVIATALLVTMHSQPADAAKPKPYRPAAATAVPSVRVHKVAATPAAVHAQKPASAQPKPVWPAATSADVVPGGPAGGPVAVRASKGAVAPAKMRVDVLDQATSARAGRPGLLFRVRRNDGSAAAATVGVAVDYRKFATAYGGDWASRLQLTRLPDCALTTPDRAECRGTPLPTTNNLATGSASANVAVAGTQLVALTASTSGADGSFGATTLSSSGTWTAGGASGNFSWSFPMRMPPAMGGPAPTVGLGYSSQSVDGLMAASNNQPSVVGEGFDLSAGGFIERRYKSCSDDTTNGNNTGTTKDADDQCWGTDNASMSLNGTGGDLIKDPSNANLWHLRNDDGSRIEHKTGAANGAQNGEWWVVTTVNGTQYWFGRNALPGAPSGTTTNSTLTVPVFGNQANEQCHQPAFADSSCVQAWRWNLDYVLDPHGNTMSLWYKKETNKYQSITTKVQTYDRDGYLDHVSYGTRREPNTDAGKDTVFTGHAASQVAFHYDDRCLSGCGTHDAAHWPDTPWDLSCTSDSTCDAMGPSFWTTHALTTVTTSVYNAISGKFDDVERWGLEHTFPDPDDKTRAGLFLSKVSHTGLVGTTTTLPDVTFAGTAMPNRVDAVDNAPPMNWPRVTDINTETGAILHIDYLPSDCTATNKPSSPQNNTMRCYPVKWSPPGFPKQTDYFNKYVVNTVTQTDRTGSGPRVLTHYSYLSDPAWHYADDDGLITDDAKTWSQWRGYQKVGVTSGDPGEQTYTESTYFRGMNGDYLTDTTTRSVSVPDSLGGTFPDEDAYAGMTRETRTLLGPQGAEISGEIDDPWQSAATATRTIDGAKVYARHVNTEGTHTRITLDHAPGERTTYVKNTFDQYGMVVQEDDQGDVAVTGDEQCTTTTYDRNANASVWLMSLPQRMQMYGVSCAKVAAGGLTDADVIGDSLTLYDGNAVGVAPTQGDVTETDQMTAYNSGSPTYIAISKSAYDPFGRVVDSWDALGRHSGTTYVPAATGPVTQTVDVNPMKWKTTTNVEPAWGLATETSDVNQLLTEYAYDGLGRLTSVWEPGRTRDQTPDVAYDYLIRTGGVNTVTTSHLNPKGGVTKSYTLYDGLLRARQTQTASPAGGRILTDTFYDSAGRASLSYGAYHDPSAGPGTDLVSPLAPEDIRNQTRTTYDGAGRPVASIFQPGGVERWRTTTTYGGDHTDVAPPAGASASSTWIDARNRTTQLRQYPTRTPTGTTYDHTDYAYNSKGLLQSVTTPDGSQWTYTYDIRGRQISSTDPDGGSNSAAYDDAGEVTSTIDGNNTVLKHTYDALGRPTAEYKSSISSANQLTQWDYDQATFAGTTTPVLGQPFQSTRIDSGRNYVETTAHYDQHYQPTSTKIAIPLAETGVGGNYIYGTGYNPDGSVSGMDYPATGDLRNESVHYNYTDYDQPLNLLESYGDDAETSIVSDSQYDALAHATQYTLYTGLFSEKGAHAYLDYETDATTGRLNEISVHRDGVSPNTVTDQHYTYDDAGNVTQIADTPTGGGYTDIQCFTYDQYQRVSQAWTPAADDCSAAPSNAALGGPAKYWQSYTYSTAGARTAMVDHATAAGDVSTTYKFTDATASNPATGQPHVLRSTTTTDSTGTKTASYTYDQAGHTKTRPGPHGTQSLVWDAEGNLQSVTDTSGSVSYLYDANGNRLISRDTTGKTLYLPSQEVRYTNSTSALSCTRYYSFAGGTVAQRTSQGLTWLASDHQGTQDVMLDASTQAATIRRQTPFGTPRGDTVTWANDKGFVGGTTDPTGLTHLGAREYDPALGRFISLDPQLDTSDPQSMQGYAYADNDPVVHADPSGLMIEGGSSGGYPPNTTNPQPPPNPQDPPSGNNGNGNQNHNKCHHFCGLKHAFTSTANWVDDHKAVIAGTIAGVVVGLGCEAAMGPAALTPVGVVACGAAAGAVSNMVEYAVNTEVDHKGNFSLGGMLKTGAVGAVVGGATALTFSMGGMAVKAGLSSLSTRAAATAARDVGESAVSKEASNAASAVSRKGFSDSAPKASEGASARGCGGHSFAAVTAVLMANGTVKAIGSIKVGDKVLAADPETGKRAAKTVTVVHVNHDTDLTDVTLNVKGSKVVLHTTQHHPFWDAAKQRFVNAADLTAGDRMSATSGSTPAVAAITSYHGAQTMYDLTVDTTHTYYVLAGNTPVLVHNCGGEIPRHAATCQCADGGPMELDLNVGPRAGGTRETEARAGDEIARDAGKTDKRIRDTAKGINNVGDIAASAVPNAPPMSAATPDGSIGGLVMACVVCVQAIRRRLSG